MKLYTVYVTRNQISRNNRKTGLSGDDSTVAYKRNVRAEGYSQAAERCLPEIWSLCDADIKVISVYVGIHKSVSAAANRLSPIQYKR